MGKKAEAPLNLPFDDLTEHLRANHAAYVQTADGTLYYITDCNEHYWRVQDTAQLNEKGHYTDASELVPTLAEFLDLKFGDRGLTLREVYGEATFYASEK